MVILVLFPQILKLLFLYIQFFGKLLRFFIFLKVLKSIVFQTVLIFMNELNLCIIFFNKLSNFIKIYKWNFDSLFTVSYSELFDFSLNFIKFDIKISHFFVSILDNLQSINNTRFEEWKRIRNFNSSIEFLNFERIDCTK